MMMSFFLNNRFNFALSNVNLSKDGFVMHTGVHILNKKTIQSSNKTSPFNVTKSKKFLFNNEVVSLKKLHSNDQLLFFELI